MDGIENMRTTIFRYPLQVVATPRKQAFSVMKGKC